MQARLLRGPRRRPGSRRRGDQEGVPRAGARAASGRQQARPARPRRSSRRPPRPTRCSPIPTAAAPTTPSATRACAPAAGRRAATRFGSFEDVLSAFFGRGDPLFSELFGFGRRGRRAAATSAAQVEVEPRGGAHGRHSRGRRSRRSSTCERCRGNGAEPGTPIRTCETCGGSGELREVARDRVRSGGADRRLPRLRRPGPRARDSRARVRRRGPDRPARAPGRSRSRPGSSPASGSGSPGPGTPARPAGRAGRPLRRGRRSPRTSASSATARIWSRVVELPATRAMLGGTVTVPTLDGEREVEVPAGRPARRADASLRGWGCHRCGAGARRPARGPRRRTCPPT